MQKNQLVTSPGNQEQSHAWFNKLISDISMDKYFYHEKMLDKQKSQAYDILMEGDDDKITDYARTRSNQYFIYKTVNRYFDEIISQKITLKKLALELSNTKILVWAEVNDDDELAEDLLIMAAAKVNHESSKYGIHISTTIVETSDNLPVPTHYAQVKIEG
jgi:hypothetical protein